jgi:hypothetical protein
VEVSERRSMHIFKVSIGRDGVPNAKFVRMVE